MAQFGKVALVGAGPGDEGLLTVRGYELLKEADCVVYDRLLNRRFLDIPGDKCEKIYVGKENHHHTLGQDKINELLLDKAKEYELVVRLKGGDPYVFGRGGEEALSLTANNVEVEVVPGISSSVAAAAMAGIPVTHRGLSQGFTVITAHSRKDEISQIDYSKLTDEDITLVFLMGLSHVGEIAKGLMEAGRDANTPVAVISNGTAPGQKKCIGKLANIGELVLEAKLPSPSIIVVGKVVELSEELAFFEKRPLFGKRIFLPAISRFEYSCGVGILKSENELEKSLREKGAEVVSVSSGKIAPVRIEADFLDEVRAEDYIVFTSAAGVNSFFYELLEEEGKDLRFLPRCRYAAVGAKTASALQKFGIRADFVPDKFNAAELAKELGRTVTDGAVIYWLCGKRHSEDMKENLPKTVTLKEIVCYENLAGAETLSEDELCRIKECDGTILTSKSSAEYALNQLKELPGEIYSIGPACSGYLRKHGITDINEAMESSYEGILGLLER